MPSDRYRNRASVRDFLTAVKEILATESTRTGNCWLAFSQLNSRFTERYGLSASDIAQQQGLAASLYDLLATSGQFSLYRTPNPEEFHIAPLLPIWPAQPPLKQEHKSTERHQPTRKEPKIGPEIVPAINSVNDFEAVLMDIIRSLTTHLDSEKVPLATVCHKFLSVYKQPIRAIRRQVAPDMALVELLQTTPGLQVQKHEGDWQIALRDYVPVGTNTPP